MIELRLIDAGQPGTKPDRHGLAAVLTAMTLNGLICEAMCPDGKNQIPGPGVARKKECFRTDLRARRAEAAFAQLEIDGRVAPLTAFKNVVFTGLEAGVAAGALSKKAFCFPTPGWTDPAVGVTPSACQHAPTGEINHDTALP